MYSNPSAGLDRSLGLQEVHASSYRQWAYEGGKVVSPTHRQPLPPEDNPFGTHFC